MFSREADHCSRHSRGGTSFAGGPPFLLVPLFPSFSPLSCFSDAEGCLTLAREQQWPQLKARLNSRGCRCRDCRVCLGAPWCCCLRELSYRRSKEQTASITCQFLLRCDLLIACVPTCGDWPLLRRGMLKLLSSPVPVGFFLLRTQMLPLL